VSVDYKSGNVLVADADTNRVFEFSGATGRFFRYTLTAAADGCRRPSGLAVGPQCGTLVVTESASDSGQAANVRAYRLHEGVMTSDVEQVWTFRTESAV